MTFAKVCGLKSKNDIDTAVSLGFDAIGIMMHAKSPRSVDFETALDLANYAKNKIKTVAVGITYSEVKAIEPNVDFIQVYEECRSDKLIFAGTQLPVKLKCNYFLYDASFGSGVKSEFPSFEKALLAKLILAGGLTVQNVKALIKAHRPFGVDVSSGVEVQRGTKDYALMSKFLAEVRDAK